MSDVPSRLHHALSDRYRIERELGQGGMATVYLADDLRHGRRVAIKVLNADVAATMGSDRFLREIRIAAGLEHPHILTLIDSGEAEGFLYYVMPYVEGRSLGDKLDREGELPVRDVARLLRGVADALAYAHRNGVVHRDIKPDNIMLSGRHAFVVDFGIAKALSEAVEGTHVTATGTAVGTPAYMSPEQAAAEPNVDHRADIYALGAVAYEMLSGRPPFMGTRSHQVLLAHVSQVPRPITEYRESVPPALEALVMRCLEKKPADRWQSAEEVLDVLEVISTGAATPVDSVSVPTTAARRVPLLKGLVAGSAVVAAAVGAWALLLQGSQTPLDPERLYVAPFVNQSADPELDPIGPVAADRILQALQEMGLVEVRGAGGATALDEEASPQEVAESLGAGTMVVGTYAAQQDSLVFQVQLQETRGGRVLHAARPAGGPRDDLSAAYDDLRDRAQGSVAGVFAPELEPWTPPSSYRAYREHLAGMEMLGRSQVPAAIRHLSAATQLDPSFLPPFIYLSIALNEAGLSLQADALLASLAEQRSRLSQVERHVVDFMLGIRGGTLGSGFQDAYAAYQLHPASDELAWIVAFAAAGDNRMQVIDEVLSPLQPSANSSIPLYREAPYSYWTLLTEARHVQGLHELELETVELHKQLFPASRLIPFEEVEALAALGRADEIVALLDGLTLSPAQRIDYGGLLDTAMDELVAHRHTEGARRFATMLTEWHRARFLDEPSRSNRVTLAAALTKRARHGEPSQPERAVLLAEARDLLQPLADAPDADYGWVAGAGIAAALAGDVDAARAAQARLATGFEERNAFGFVSAAEARLALALGDTTASIGHLREAFGRGIGYLGWYHDSLYEALQDHPTFQELTRPKR